MTRTDDLGTLYGSELMEGDFIVITIEEEQHEVELLDVVDEYDIKVKAFSHTNNHVYPEIHLKHDEEYEVWGA